MKYTFDSRVRYSEVDHTGAMTVPNVINYFQDCSTFQSEELGVGLKELRAKNRGWLLASWQVEFIRAPKMGERITIGTFAHGFKGFFGLRNFFMDDEAGEHLAYANSMWFFMDNEKGRPARPEPEDTQMYGVEPPLKMEYKDRKIKIPEQVQERESFPVRRYHIDTNEHVNNAEYVQMAMEFLPREIKVKELRVEYKRAAVLGDVIYPKVAMEADRSVVMLCDKEGAPYAVAEFS
ncbi:MAG: thioesterase [Hespellia sp.]|nr:thioesterase [Hespellia sp.]